LVGSTALLSRVGEERAELLRREHFRVIAGCDADSEGREVKNMSDGLMVVYTSPSAAVNGAVAMQQRLDARNRRSEEAMLVRIGVSVGEADVEDGGYFGSSVVEAARLCAKADGGQIVTTDIVRALTGSRGGHKFSSR
jgi:adenylate cyclase